MFNQRTEATGLAQGLRSAECRAPAKYIGPKTSRFRLANHEVCQPRRDVFRSTLSRALRVDSTTTAPAWTRAPQALGYVLRDLQLTGGGPIRPTTSE